MRKIFTERATRRSTESGEHGARRDSGHTGVEMVVVLGIVGLLASSVALLITGMTTEAAEGGCVTDARELHTAAASYLVVHDLSTIPAGGSEADRFEMTLVEGGFLRAPSALYDLTVSGGVIAAEGSPC